jgi:hypothetical protein
MRNPATHALGYLLAALGRICLQVCNDVVAGVELEVIVRFQNYFVGLHAWRAVAHGKPSLSRPEIPSVGVGFLTHLIHEGSFLRLASVA